ncbi:MAG: metallophosphoesterase [Erysipelotrichales bacterium]|nr:metallophosphoesterase [Erysipelotrichales bacterium]
MLRIRNYLLKNNLIKKDTVIVNITDIHSEYKKLKDIVKYIDLIQPDIVTISGDTLDSINNANNQEVFNLLVELSKKVKLFIGVGNHDSLIIKKSGLFAKTREVKDYTFFDNLKKETDAKVFIDNNEVYDINGIRILGFNLPIEWYKDGENVLEFNKRFDTYKKEINLSDDVFSVLLIHSCNGIINNNKLNNEINGVNLVLSGHNHAGITPEFIQKYAKMNRGLIGPYSKWFMSGCYGYWTNNNTSVILSNGVTKMGKSHGSKLVRSLVNGILKSDIEVITLTNGNEHSLELTSIIHQK